MLLVYEVVNELHHSPWGAGILAVATAYRQQLLPKSNQGSTTRAANQLRIGTVPQRALAKG
jgi:hypothetical protein